MMLILLTLLLSEGVDSQAITAGGHFMEPAPMWDDFDNDGKLDVMVYDRGIETEDRTRILVWYGGAPTDAFRELTFDPIPYFVVPGGTATQPFPVTDDDTMQMHFVGEWQVTAPISLNLRQRPGLQPIKKDNNLLLPVYGGYVLIEDGCQTHFKVPPSIKLKSQEMNLVWPVPQFVDLNNDGQYDLQTAPTQYTAARQLRIWTALRENDSWTTGWAKMSFPDHLALVRHEIGDIDGDGVDDMVVLARPEKNFSVFDELSLVVYQGLAEGGWSERPHQVIQSKQNLWQTGPVEINPGGVILYYYKGLMRSHFKIDRYVWNEAGFLDPKPQSQKWTLKDAARSVIEMDMDANGDGRKDLILYDDEGLHVFYRKAQGQFPFENTPKRLPQTAPPDEDGDPRRIRIGRLRDLDEAALVSDNGVPSLWWFEEDMAGNLSLHRR